MLPRLKWWLPLIPWAVSSLNFKGFDAVLSSSSGFVKNITVPFGSVHICYCHTPTRFLWLEPCYVDQEVPSLLKPLARLFLGYMRRWDAAGSRRVTHFIANSSEVKHRIQTVYGRTSTVIYPAVNTSFWRQTAPRASHFLLAGRLQAHKQADFAVRVCTEYNLPLRVVGTGRDLEHLRAIAGPSVTFLGRVSDEQLRVPR